MSSSKYKDTYPAELIQLMSQGKSRVQVAAHWGVSKWTIDEWKNDPNKPEFVEAYKIAKTCCEAYHEDIGQKGAKGVYPKFNYPAWAKIMGSRFKDDWAEVHHQKIELKNEVDSMTAEELDEAINLLISKRNNSSSGSTPAQQAY